MSRGVFFKRSIFLWATSVLLNVAQAADPIPYMVLDAAETPHQPDGELQGSLLMMAGLVGFTYSVVLLVTDDLNYPSLSFRTVQSSLLEAERNFGQHFRGVNRLRIQFFDADTQRVTEQIVDKRNVHSVLEGLERKHRGSIYISKAALSRAPRISSILSLTLLLSGLTRWLTSLQRTGPAQITPNEATVNQLILDLQAILPAEARR